MKTPFCIIESFAKTREAFSGQNLDCAEAQFLDSSGARARENFPLSSLSDLISASGDDESSLPADVNDAVYSMRTDTFVSFLHDPRLGFFERMDIARASGDRGAMDDAEYSAAALSLLAPDADGSSSSGASGEGSNPSSGTK